MAEPKKKERQDGPALPESVIPEQKTNERDEAAYLSSPAAERFRAESEDETPIVQQAKKEGLLEKSDARRESAMAPSIMELVLIPHASQPDRDQLETKIAGLAMEVGGALSPDEKPGEETTRSGGPETTPAALNLTIPANQTARFKALLAGLGRIEDENRDPADSQEEIREKALKAPLGSGFSMMAAPPPPSILIIITLTPPEKP